MSPARQAFDFRWGSPDQTALRALVGARSKMAYGLGKKVRVRVDRVSWDRMRPEFTCLGEWKEEKS